MHSLWKHYNTAYSQYEKNYPLAYPWNRSGKEDAPRYVLGADGDVLLFNGAKETNLCVTVRRLFGISDGYLPNSEFYTGTTPLPL